MRKTWMLSLVVVAIAVVAVFLWPKLRNSKSETGSPDKSADKSISQQDRLLALDGFLYRFREGGLSPVVPGVRFGGAISQWKGPAITLDRQWAAYINADELFVYGLASGEARQVTRLHQPSNDEFQGIDLYVQGWSHDGSRVLFRVDAVEDCDECEPRKIRPAEYGYHAYNVATGQIVRVRLPEQFEFRAWLPDGSFLGTASVACGGDSAGNCTRLAIAHDGSAEMRPLEDFNGDHRELVVSADGHFALTTLPFLSREDRTNQSQIMRINLSSGMGEMLTSLGSYPEWRQPRFSPQGTGMAWLYYHQKPDGMRYLYVHPRNEIYKCRDLEDFAWMDEQHIIVQCGRSFDFIDTSGKLVARLPSGDVQGR